MEIDLIGISPNITKIRKLIDQVTDTDLNIVVCGETRHLKNNWVLSQIK